MSPKPPLLSGRALVKIFTKLGYHKVKADPENLRWTSKSTYENIY